MKFGFNPTQTRIFMFVLVVFTSAGSVLFFPLNIEGKYTCYYHQTFDHSHPVIKGDNNEPLPGSNKNITEPGNDHLNHKENAQSNHPSLHHGSLLLDNYLHQYAFAWWASIGLLTLCIYLLLNRKKQIKRDQSELIL